MRRIAVLGGAAGVLGVLALGQPAFAMDQAATIKLFQFQPGNLEVKVGTTVTWTNGDDIEHSVTSGAPGKESKVFDSGFFKKGGTYSFTFTTPGTYTYFCKRHNSMKATVTVIP
ncbi:plastocyanin/azurin family copper-binding protein [Aestuariivirga sp.]|uniref:cupredoxin domain-containing protein n=1 Tax=Aestuariivirga sp. TaxID=2650926 RepID=UPI0039E3CBFC